MRSFLDVARDSEFPLQNLPYGVFCRPGEDQPRVGVRIGNWVLDLKVLEHAGLFRDTLLGDTHVFCKRALNKFMSLGRPVWASARRRIQDLLREDNPQLRDDAGLRAQALVPVEQVQMCLPAEIGDYTDFYSSRQHATNVGTMFRGPDQALMPNWVWLPVAYHGRASSIVVSGTDIRRPCGQTRAEAATAPTFGPTRQLDFELEMGLFIGPGNRLGEPIPIDQAEQHIFGLVIVNDWSARDIQKWEYQPLGPFLGKNFATTISPWVVPVEALEPFRCPAPPQDPQPLSYLRLAPSGAPCGGRAPDGPGQASAAAAAGRPAGAPASCGLGATGHTTYDIELEVALQTPGDSTPQVICRSRFRDLYWTMAQQIAHHTSNGCNLRPGDLLASGTISGDTPDSLGCLLELTWRGQRPLRLASGEQRTFLEDGDRVIMRAYCRGPDYRIGFGECSGRVLPARGA